MAGMDNFKPSQGKPISMAGAAAPQVNSSGLSQVIPAGLNRTNGQQVAVSVHGMQQSPLQNQSPIGSSNTPKGAQPVSIVGQQMNTQFGSPIAPQAAPKLPLSPAAQGHFLGQQKEDMDVHTISVEGETPDGRKYEASYDAHFPRGTKILGVTSRVK